MSTLFLCEKPSQARDIAAVLGVRSKGEFSISTAAGEVTWAIGHLLQMCDPDEMEKKWSGPWTWDSLPIAPAEFPTKPYPKTRSHLSGVKKLLKTATRVVIATDADREGEMIAREILDDAKWKGSIERLWLSALDAVSIKNALARLRPDSETRSLYYAALARSRADWLVGMNFSRAYTILAHSRGQTFSVGRVQTPTLSLVVRRDLAIENFKAVDFFTLAASVESSGVAPFKLFYRPEEKILVRGEAEKIAEASRGFTGALKVEKTPKKQAPPKLFSLSTFTKAANAAFGWSAKDCLKIAQSLYETHKVATYPRSDCEFLPEEQIAGVPSILAAAMPHFSSFGINLGPDALAQPVIRKSVFDTSKITAHHAIIPTAVNPPISRMSSDEHKGYGLILKRYVAALMPDYEFLQTKIALEASVTFSATGSTPVKPGWKAVFASEAQEDSEGGDGSLPDLANGAAGKIQRIEIEAKKTSPPDRYTEGTLIEDMKSVAKFVEDPEKRKRLRDTSGIGTEATRANILGVLFARDFMATTKQGRKQVIISTPTGRSFIAHIEATLPELADPAETAAWETRLEDIALGKEEYQSFVAEIAERITSNLQLIRKSENTMSTTLESKCPKSGNPVKDFGNNYVFDGYPDGRFPKVVAGRPMSADDYVKILTSATPVDFEGFKSRVGKAFLAQLRFNPDREYDGKKSPGVELVFANEARETKPSTDLSASCPKSGKPAQDVGDSYTFPGFPGLYCRKEFLGRAMSVEDYVGVLASPEGAEFEGFVSKKTGRTFGAALRYEAKTKFNGKPGIELEFK